MQGGKDVKIHIVQKGDTLWKIAQKYDVNFEELKQMNAHLSNPDMIMPGMKIKVPAESVPVKKKEMPKKEAVQPYIDKSEKPKAVMKEQPAPKKEAPKMPEMPKMPMPQQPQPQPQPQMQMQMPQMSQEVDVNNYMFNLPPFPTMQQPIPQVAGVQDEEEVDVEGMDQEAVPPPMPAMPQPMPMMHQPMMPQQVPMYPYPPNCVPVSPVMPGSGFSPYGGGYPTQQMPPMPTAVSPAVDEDLDDNEVPNMPGAGLPAEGGYPQPVMAPQAPMMQQPMMMPQQAPMYSYPPNCMPVSPVMPGSGLPGGGMPLGYQPQAAYPTAVNPAMYGNEEEWDDEAPWMNVPPAGGDCGCESDDDYPMMPQAGAGYGAQNYGNPHMMPGYGMPNYGTPNMMPGYGMPNYGAPNMMSGYGSPVNGVPNIPYGPYQTPPYPPFGLPTGQPGNFPQTRYEDDED